MDFPSNKMRLEKLQRRQMEGKNYDFLNKSDKNGKFL